MVFYCLALGGGRVDYCHYLHEGYAEEGQEAADYGWPSIDSSEEADREEGGCDDIASSGYLPD